MMAMVWPVPLTLALYRGWRSYWAAKSEGARM